MNLIKKIELWGDAQHTKWLDVVRIVLGLLIFSKGIALISNTGYLQELLFQKNNFGFSQMMGIVALHLAAFTHLVGGILLTIGLVTRFASVIQIPIVLCAIIFVNISNGFSPLNAELWLSIIVLCLLILFWITGSGTISVDHRITRKSRSY